METNVQLMPVGRAAHRYSHPSSGSAAMNRTFLLTIATAGLSALTSAGYYNVAKTEYAANWQARAQVQFLFPK